MRKDKKGTPVFNLEQEYIKESIHDYMFCEYNSGDSDTLWEGTEYQAVENLDEPLENEYGGFWYLKGKRSQKKLMEFYEKHGFQEDSDIHLNWCCFTEVPYPTMRLSLE